MTNYHCSIDAIDAPQPMRVVLYTLNGIARVGFKRALTKEEKQQLKPSKKRRQSNIDAALEEFLP